MVQLIHIKKYILIGLAMNSVLHFTNNIVRLSVPKIRKLAPTIFTAASYSFFKLLKLSKISGYRLSSFTVGHVMTPVLALGLSSSELLGVTVLRTCVHLLTHSTLGIFGFLYYLPSLTGALYFKSLLSGNLNARIACALAPLVCMAIFVSTPVGSVAWIYSLCWTIPAAIALLPRNNIFLTALASTYMAHAVGSVLFILSTPMVPAFWIGLLPVVAFERCMLAAGITAVYYAIIISQQAYKIVSARLAIA